MSDDAAIFESETELDIFPPKWKRKFKKKMSHCLGFQIMTFKRTFKDSTTAILTIFQLRLSLYYSCLLSLTKEF